VNGREGMNKLRLVFRVHAIQRMFQRTISEDEVRQVVDAGETIETYLDDKPFPSRLMLGWKGARPIHVVIADNSAAHESIIFSRT
jgi:hypothetical protein